MRCWGSTPGGGCEHLHGGRAGVMSIDMRSASADDLIWSERDTSPHRIESELRQLLRERYASDRRLAPARVLNLVVVLDRAWRGEVANRLERVGRYHASRTILCAVEEGRTKLDALAVMSYRERTAGGIGVMHETVEIEIGPSHLAHLKTIVDPVVASELPTVLWVPHGHEEAISALLGMIDVVLLDTSDLLEPEEALAHARELLDHAYVVDLAWLRTTPWRERLASSFDVPDRRSALHELEKVSIRHNPESIPSALMLAGWLASRLHWDVEPLRSRDGAGMRGMVGIGSGREAEISLEPVDQSVPGLAGLTVSWDERCSLSLDRGRGGLTAREQTPRSEHSWRVLGASRGEGGILGEGVRQALLRDPTYAPALDAARALSV
jgi:glucose-6-phosphate dehydrogenase assembly protein OpcA